MKKLTPAEYLSILLVIICLALFFTTSASANPAPQGQSLTLYAGGYSSQVRGDAYGSERTDARLFYYGYWHNWVGCYRSSWSVHLWICNGAGGPAPGYYAQAEVAYYNANGWSYGFSPSVYDSCCEARTATSGVLG